MIILVCGCSLLIPAGSSSNAFTPTPTTVTGAPGATPVLTGKLTSCADPLTVVGAFYDANDAKRYDRALSFFADGASLHTWAQGLYGDRMEDRQMTGKGEIQAALSLPGFQHSTGKPDSPIYHVSEAQAVGDKLSFYLRPDRLGPNDRPYNPFQVTIQFEGCEFKAMTVIEIISWV